MSDTKKNSVVDFVALFDPKDVGIQPLGAREIVNSHTDEAGVTKLTFITKEITAAEIATKKGKVPLVLWFNRDAYEAALKKLSEK